MMRLGLVIGTAFILGGTQAMADSTELMFCAIEDSSKMVSVRLDGPDVTYAYGNLNEMSDLILTEAAVDVDYQPWPGVSNAIWETVTFYNGDYGYIVTMGVERKDNPDKFGGITVTKNGAEIASLNCIPESVSFVANSPLYDIRTDAGWCVDRGAKGGWERCD